MAVSPFLVGDVESPPRNHYTLTRWASSRSVGRKCFVGQSLLPHKARVFYLFVPDSDEVIVLGLLPRGGAFRPRGLGPDFEQD